MNRLLAVNPYLNSALVVAIGSILLIEAWLGEVTEIVPWGAEFGVVYYSLCISIMASYIFYFIVVHLKEQADKDNIDAFVAIKVFGILNDFKIQMRELKRESKFSEEDYYLSQGQLGLIFKAISPKGKAPLILGQSGQHGDWMLYLKMNNERVQKSIQKIFAKMTFLDSKLVKILADIDDCDHFNAIESMYGMQFSNTDMSAWSGMFHRYSVLMECLDIYYQSRLEDYKP